MEYPRARKRFGQNFLQDEYFINEIIEAIDPKRDDHIVEIGPGRGALTTPLLKRCNHLDVIEIDRDLVPLLQQRHALHPSLTIHLADALQFDYRRLQISDEPLRIVGNLPYNITTPLLFHLLDYSDIIEDMCFMLQKEVVERICAQPGTKQYGKLSIMIQHRCDAQLLFHVPPEAFAPAPKVDSAILFLQPLKHRIGGAVDIGRLSQLVSQAFSQRRKTVSNTLKNMISADTLRANGIDPEQRPETIDIAQYVELTRTLS